MTPDDYAKRLQRLETRSIEQMTNIKQLNRRVDELQKYIAITAAVIVLIVTVWAAFKFGGSDCGLECASP